MRVPVLLLGLALPSILGCAAPAPQRTAEERPAREAPPVMSSHGQDGLNAFVLETLRSYPVDGSFGYYWPKPGEDPWEGTTQDVVYGGRKLTSGDPLRRSYCCGLTFEVYVNALLAANGGGPVAGVSADELHELRLRFFGDSKQVHERRRLAQFGLESLGLGRSIVELEEALPGDFVQFWRHSGSGHSAIFVGWVRREGAIAGLTYWSSQGSTKGIGYCTEWIGPDGVKADEIYLGRAGWPIASPPGERRSSPGSSDR